MNKMKCPYCNHIIRRKDEICNKCGELYPTVRVKKRKFSCLDCFGDNIRMIDKFPEDENNKVLRYKCQNVIQVLYKGREYQVIVTSFNNSRAIVEFTRDYKTVRGNRIREGILKVIKNSQKSSSTAKEKSE